MIKWIILILVLLYVFNHTAAMEKCQATHSFDVCFSALY